MRRRYKVNSFRSGLSRGGDCARARGVQLKGPVMQIYQKYLVDRYPRQSQLTAANHKVRAYYTP